MADQDRKLAADEKTRSPQPAGSAAEAVRRANAAMKSGDLLQATAWIKRAHRLAPRDATLVILLASIVIHTDPETAVAKLQALVERAPWRAEAAMALAAALLRAGHPAEAAGSLSDMLARMTPPATGTFQSLAAAICDAARLPGWVALDGTGRCRVMLGQAAAVRTVRITLDGHVAASVRVRPGQIATCQLGEGWATASVLHATAGGEALAGSGLTPAAFTAVEGYAEAAPDGTVSGWARLQADPGTCPSVFQRAQDGQLRTIPLTPDISSDSLDDPEWRSRGWVFRLEPTELLEQSTVEIVGASSRHVWGSPLILNAERNAAQDAARSLAGTRTLYTYKPDAFRPLPASLLPAKRVSSHQARASKRPPCDVVVPVYGGLAELEACLHSLTATLPRGSRLVLVNDGSPDPAIAALLLTAQAPGVTVLTHDRPVGFPAAVNAGLRHLGPSATRDVVILNGDTIVSRHWLERLSTVAHSDPAIGSVTPLTNDGTIVSYPEPDKPETVPDAVQLAELSELCWEANGSAAVDIPTGVGFCMLMKAACLAEVGLLRADVFAQGYGEENDWCLRAAHLGWRHVAAPGVFVAHSGGRSFGAAKTLLLERNAAVLERLHPGYAAYVDVALASEPLFEARRRVDRLKLLGSPGQHAVALITHKGGGGVARHVAWRCAVVAASGRRPIVLSPLDTVGQCGLSVWANDGMVDLPNLRFKLPAELPQLAAVLRDAAVTAMEIHHLLEHDLSITELPVALGVPYSAFVHDYGHWCPRITLTSRGQRYCGEPLSQHVCEECIADLGSRYDEDVTVASLRAHSSRLLAAAECVAVSCEDVAGRIRRQFPGVLPEIVPWEDDATGRITLPPRPARNAGSEVHVVVAGAIGIEKGYDVLLFCARDAAKRGLPLRFTVVGFTIDDDRLIATGRVFVTGQFEEAEGLGLVQAQQGTIGFVPSVWPETWCYALSLLWRAGLPVMAFGLGAQGYRIERSEAGWLIPVGVSVSKINDALVSRGNGPLDTLAASSQTTGVQ